MNTPPATPLHGWLGLEWNFSVGNVIWLVLMVVIFGGLIYHVLGKVFPLTNRVLRAVIAVVAYMVISIGLTVLLGSSLTAG